jgi:hypothetical protein
MARMSPKKQSADRADSTPAPNANAPLGQGGRFEALKEKLADRPGVTNPGGLAAYIGRKKYGKKKFAQLGQKGK